MSLDYTVVAGVGVCHEVDLKSFLEDDIIKEKFFEYSDMDDPLVSFYYVNETTPNTILITINRYSIIFDPTISPGLKLSLDPDFLVTDEELSRVREIESSLNIDHKDLNYIVTSSID